MVTLTLGHATQPHARNLRRTGWKPVPQVFWA